MTRKEMVAREFRDARPYAPGTVSYARKHFLPLLQPRKESASVGAQREVNIYEKTHFFESIP